MLGVVASAKRMVFTFLTLAIITDRPFLTDSYAASLTESSKPQDFQDAHSNYSFYNAGTRKSFPITLNKQVEDR